MTQQTTSVNFTDFSPNAQWGKVYKILCGKKVDCAGIAMPSKPVFLSWPIIIVPQVPLNAAFAGLKRIMPCWSYYGDDLEAAIDWQQEERDGRTNPYGIWVGAVVEATEDLNNCSASVIKKRKLKTTTLHERVCLEAFYWVLTGGKQGGKHLDLIGLNLCPGSRGPDGDVPSVCWHGSKVDVRRTISGNADPNYGARQVVTL